MIRNDLPFTKLYRIGRKRKNQIASTHCFISVLLKIFIPKIKINTLQDGVIPQNYFKQR